MKYILHDQRNCPPSIRVRIMLHLKKVDHQVVVEPMPEWTPWMKDWGKKSNRVPRVPVLRITADDGLETILIESNFINSMLDAEHAGTLYTPAKDTEKYREMVYWFLWCDDFFKHKIDRFEFGKNEKFDDAEHVEDVKILRELVRKLETSLDAQTYLLGDELTLADIAIIPYVRHIMVTRDGEFDFTDFPKTEKWVRSIIDTDWFKETVMKEHEPTSVSE